MAGVKIDEIGKDKLERVQAILGGIGRGDAVYHAVGAAMKRAAQSGKTQAGYYASRQYNISKSLFMAKSHIGYELASHSGGTGITLSFSGGVIPLAQFGGTTASKTGGVNASPKMGGGNIRSAFIVAMYGNNVFERISRFRFPLERKYGPSTGHMMQDEGVSEALASHMEEVFDSRIEHEITRILNGW